MDIVVHEDGIEKYDMQGTSSGEIHIRAKLGKELFSRPWKTHP